MNPGQRNAAGNTHRVRGKQDGPGTACRSATPCCCRNEDDVGISQRIRVEERCAEFPQQLQAQVKDRSKGRRHTSDGGQEHSDGEIRHRNLPLATRLTRDPDWTRMDRVHGNSREVHQHIRDFVADSGRPCPIFDLHGMEEEIGRALKRELERDKRSTSMHDMTPTGLVEITGKRVRDSLDQLPKETCRTCGGSGYLKTLQAACYEIFRELPCIARQSSPSTAPDHRQPLHHRPVA